VGLFQADVLGRGLVRDRVRPAPQACSCWLCPYLYWYGGDCRPTY